MRHVATSVDKFFGVSFTPFPSSPSLIELLQQCADHGQVNTRWAIGARGINQTQVKIIGAVHVSAGSWMPLIQLTRYVI
jgi:hypothetical protein